MGGKISVSENSNKRVADLTTNPHLDVQVALALRDRLLNLEQSLVHDLNTQNLVRARRGHNVKRRRNELDLNVFKARR